MIEIERTYLVKSLPENLESYPHQEISQGYLSELPDPLRVRSLGTKFELTKKVNRSSDKSTAEEITISINGTEFNRLWSLVIRSLEKTRYLIPISSSLTAELDVFRGKLEGLAFVEVEFQSPQQMVEFKPPEWFGTDVTEEELSSNFFLTNKSFDEINSLMTRFK